MAGDDEPRDEDDAFDDLAGEPLELESEAAKPTSEFGEQPGVTFQLRPEDAVAEDSPRFTDPTDVLSPVEPGAVDAAAAGGDPPSAQPGPFVHANTISSPAAAPIGTHSRSYPLPLLPEAQPSGPDDLLQHLPQPAAPRLEPPRTSAQPTPSVARDSVANPLPRVVITVTLAEAKADTNDLLEDNARRTASQLRQITKSEIQQELWWQQAQRPR